MRTIPLTSLGIRPITVETLSTLAFTKSGLPLSPPMYEGALRHARAKKQALERWRLLDADIQRTSDLNSQLAIEIPAKTKNDYRMFRLMARQRLHRDLKELDSMKDELMNGEELDDEFRQDDWTTDQELFNQVLWTDLSELEKKSLEDRREARLASSRNDGLKDSRAEKGRQLGGDRKSECRESGIGVIGGQSRLLLKLTAVVGAVNEGVDSLSSPCICTVHRPVMSPLAHDEVFWAAALRGLCPAVARRARGA